MQGVVARRNNFAEPILEFLEAAWKDFGDLTGRYYGLVSKYKTDDAETVFVSLGSAAENIEAAVDYLRETRGSSVGSIHVNVIRPFPEAAIVEALRGKKNVIILERTDEASAPTIRWAAISAPRSPRPCKAPPASPRSRTRWKVPRIIGGTYGLGSRDFRPEHVIGAFEFATAGRARTDGHTTTDGTSFIVLGIPHPYSVVAEDRPSLLPGEPPSPSASTPSADDGAEIFAGGDGAPSADGVEADSDCAFRKQRGAVSSPTTA